MDLRHFAKKYNAAGLACLPTKQDKSPDVTDTWKGGVDTEKFLDCAGIGIICGKISGGLECMDFDNHAGDAKDKLIEWQAIPEVAEIFARHKFVIEKSQSGGYHVLYRCAKNEGNRKLALQLLDGKPDCFIETRGEGGYFVCAPSIGYKWLKGDETSIPTISEVDRAILIDNAVSMNKVMPQVQRTDFESDKGDRPGDVYNSIATEADVAGMLKDAGWQEITPGRWRRPGKKQSISATLGKVAKNIFYCFSSNGFPFESGKGYTAFQVLGLLKYNGNFSEAAKSIPMPEKEKTYNTKRVKIIPPSELETILNQSKIDTSKPVVRPPTVLSIRENEGTRSVERRLFTLGNFSCITGKWKSRKTFLISKIVSVVLAEKEIEFLIPGDIKDKKDIVLFDTEQGEDDAYDVISRIEKMSGKKGAINAYKLRPFSPMERCQIIEYVLEKFKNSLKMVIIDGVADLGNGILDEEEATRVVTLLMKWSDIYKCHILTVLHQNKNDNFATGHMGSAVMKKAEMIIALTGHDTETEVECDRSRGIPFKSFILTIDSEGLPHISKSAEKRTAPADKKDWDENTEPKPEKVDKVRQRELEQDFNDSLF